MPIEELIPWWALFFYYLVNFDIAVGTREHIGTPNPYLFIYNTYFYIL